MSTNSVFPQDSRTPAAPSIVPFLGFVLGALAVELGIVVLIGRAA